MLKFVLEISTFPVTAHHVFTQDYKGNVYNSVITLLFDDSPTPFCAMTSAVKLIILFR